MFCKDCGAQLAKGADFCPHCGSAQAVTPPTELDFADKVRHTVKKLGASTAFLVATVCLTFVQLLGLFALTPAGGIFEMCYGIIPEFSGASGNLLASLERLSPVTEIIGMIPGILIALGLWITFCRCASRKAKVGTSGLTMIFAVNLAQLVLSCLALLSALIPLTALLAGAYPLFDAGEDFMESIVLTAGLVILMIFAFVLVYYIKLCTIVSNVRSTLKTGVPNRKASRFVAILCYMGGGICILSGIFCLLSAGVVTMGSYYNAALSYTLSSEMFFTAVSALLTAVAQILFGSLIFTYRRKMKALEAEERILAFQTLSYAEPYTSPVYIPPEPATEPEVAPEPKTEELDETKRWDC